MIASFIAFTLVAQQAPPRQAVDKVSAKIIASALDQLNWGITYDPAYLKIPYPGGDVPKNMGVCTDVLIRSLRAAGVDLQEEVHKDMKAAWKVYPKKYGLRRPDPNIDHRRVPNLRVFFRRKSAALPLTSDWKPGDIVDWVLPNGRDHVGILTDQRGPSGSWMVVHNLGGMAHGDDFQRFRIVGHYRYPRR